MVEVFKTNVQDKEQSAILIALLAKQFPNYQINFDLEDCDKILRIEGVGFDPIKITHKLNAKGFECEILE